MSPTPLRKFWVHHWLQSKSNPASIFSLVFSFGESVPYVRYMDGLHGAFPIYLRWNKAIIGVGIFVAYWSLFVNTYLALKNTELTLIST